MVRAAARFGLGIILGQSAAQVLIVLVPLGLLTLICIPLVRLPAWAIGVICALGVIATPLIGGYGPYRMSAFIAYAAAGMLIVRVLTSRTRPAPLRLLLVGSGLLAVMLALLVAPNVLGLFEVHAYDGSLAETAGDLAGAAGILTICWWMHETALVRCSARVRALACAPGQMSLTLYTLQIIVLDMFVRLNPGQRDDSWPMMFGLIIGLLAVAMLWRTATSRGTSRWRRGPLEGATDWLAAAASRRSATASSDRPETLVR